MIRTIIMPIGIPGSGKTTARFMFQQKFPHLDIVCPDDIRFKMLRSEETGIYFDQEIEPIIWKKVYSAINHAIENNRSIYLDATNLNSDNRKEILDKIQPYGYDVIYYYLKTPLWVALIRNYLRPRQVPVNVIKRMYDSIQLPENTQSLHVKKQRGTVIEFIKYLFLRNFFK